MTVPEIILHQILKPVHNNVHKRARTWIKHFPHPSPADRTLGGYGTNQREGKSEMLMDSRQSLGLVPRPLCTGEYRTSVSLLQASGLVYFPLFSKFFLRETHRHL